MYVRPVVRVKIHDEDAYRGPVLWNALPENIKKCESLNGFKQCLKLHVV